MHVLFLFLETIGTGELLLIAFVALIVFGPRKLPELGRSLGRSLGEFKRASEDFKRTWEHEVEMERLEPGKRVEQEAKVPRSSPLPSERLVAPAEAEAAANNEARPTLTDDASSIETSNTIARTSSPAASGIAPPAVPDESMQEAEANHAAPAGKQDWL